MNKKRIFDDKFDIIAFIMIGMTFAYFVFFREVAECGDSFQYENQYPMREPVYSLMLQLFQIVAKENYMKMTGLVQNILTFACTYWSYKRLRKIYDFGYVMSLGVVGILLSPHLVTPLASKTRLVLTNTIMTEGITLGLYYVWIVMLLSMLCGIYSDKKIIHVSAINLLLSLLLAMTRGQMILCIVVWMLVNIVVLLMGNKETSKKTIIIAWLFVGMIASLAIKTQLTKWYNLIETGYYVNTVSSKPMILANLVYVCDEEDANYIEDEDLREFFRGVVKETQDNELSMDYAPNGIIAKAQFHESGHETINFDYIDIAIRPVVSSRYGIDESEYINMYIHEDMLCGDIVKQLLPNVLSKYVKNYVIIASLGFVRSVSIEKSMLSYWAVLMYILAVVVIIIGLKYAETRINALTMLLVLVVICGTVLGTSLMIECITRYMIYNLPFFYIVGLGTIKSLLGLKDLRKS